MADPPQRHDFPLRFFADRIAPDRQLQRVAVGIKYKQRFFDRTWISVKYRTINSQFTLFASLYDFSEILRRHFETVNHAVQWPRRRRCNRKILQRQPPTFVVGERVKKNLRHLAIEPADRQVGQMIELTAHESCIEAMRPAEIVARQHTVIDAFNCRFLIFTHLSPRSIDVSILRADRSCDFPFSIINYPFYLPDRCCAVLIRSPTGFHSIQSWRIISI